MSVTPEIELDNGTPECPHCFGEIDTWSVEKRAIKATEERIIALLDQKHTPHEGDTTHNESGECTACEVIALIKGETK